jgi:hypothetical protein
VTIIEEPHATVSDLADEDLDQPKWLGDTLNIVRRICQRKEEFTSDDIWAVAAHLKSRPDDRRVIGSVLRTAAYRKYCKPTERFIPSKRRVNHGRRVMVWESLLFEE